MAELSFGMRPAEELYDLKNDPHQMVNVEGSTVMAEVQASLRGRLFDPVQVIETISETAANRRWFGLPIPVRLVERSGRRLGLSPE